MTPLDLAPLPEYLQKHVAAHAGHPVVIGTDGKATLPRALVEDLGDAIAGEVAHVLAKHAGAPGRYVIASPEQAAAIQAERATVARMGGNPFAQGKAFNLTRQIEVLATNPELGKKLRAQAEAGGVLAPGAVRA